MKRLISLVACSLALTGCVGYRHIAVLENGGQSFADLQTRRDTGVALETLAPKDSVVVADDGGNAGFRQRGKTIRRKRVVQAVGEVMEGVDERSVKVEYAEFNHVAFFYPSRFVQIVLIENILRQRRKALIVPSKSQTVPARPAGFRTR